MEAYSVNSGSGLSADFAQDAFSSTRAGSIIVSSNMLTVLHLKDKVQITIGLGDINLPGRCQDAMETGRVQLTWTIGQQRME